SYDTGVAKNSSSNVAVTLVAALIANASSVSVPVWSPVQPTSRHPSAGTAVSVTKVPSGYSTRSGDRTTVPEPTVFTVSPYTGISSNVAVTLVAALIANASSGSAPVWSPVQPTKRHPSAGTAVNVTK